MVEGIPTKTVQIMSLNDTMKRSQNHKINKKIWNQIEGEDFAEITISLNNNVIKTFIIKYKC